MNTFITTALPYANGDLHWGHFYEAIIADIYAKHKKLPLISGDDQHGAAITLFVEKNKLNIEQHLENQYLSHLSQYNRLGINFSHFGKTHSPIHTQLVTHFYQILKDKGLIFSKSTISWFDEEKQQFLPDRYVRGQCPACYKDNVYPHVCEHCNHYFEAHDLIHPVSSLSQTTPVLKQTEHFFLDSSLFYDKLNDFCESLQIHDSIKKKILDKSLKQLNEIDISRDLPYFGIKIPDYPLAFYVWFDAPIGYLSLILESILHKQPSLSFHEGLHIIQNLHIEHIIGKDIAYFHTFFWLNLLDILDFKIPDKIHVHGWITQENGEKYSKSQGDSLNLYDFSDEQIDAIRFYFTSIYDKSINDNIFSLKKSYEYYNQFIVGKFVNIYSRISKLLENRSISRIELHSNSHYDYQSIIEKHLDSLDLKYVVKNLFSWIDEVNSYIQDKKPWKTDSQEDFIDICTCALNEFHLISQYIGLICPYLNHKIKVINYSDIYHIHLSDKISS